MVRRNPIVLALHDLQRAVCRSLVEGDDSDVAAYVLSDGIAAASRLNIYRNTLFGTLTNALRLSYPAIHRLVGGEFFEAAAHAFINAQPPRGAYLDEYGSGFPDFLAWFPAATSVPYLSDVAQLESSVTRALHSADATSLEVMKLRSVDEDEHRRVCFVPHPSVSLIRADYPADAIWRAVLEGSDVALETIDLDDAPVWLLIERISTAINVTRLSEAAWKFTSALCDGQPLGQAIDLAPAIDISTLLAKHLAAGRFIAFSVTQSSAVSQATAVFDECA
jgi:hypothetical protein